MVISFITSLKSLPSLAISDGFVVTPHITPKSFAFFISSIFAVSTNIISLLIIPPISYIFLLLSLIIDYYVKASHIYSINSSGVPDSPNVSFIPTILTIVGHSPHTTCDTIAPSPPIIECSSAVTIPFVSFAAFIINSLSIGFIVEIFITLALIP